MLISFVDISIVVFLILCSMQKSAKPVMDTSTQISTDFTYHFSNFTELTWADRGDPDARQNLTIFSGQVGGVVSWTISDDETIELSNKLPHSRQIDMNDTFPIVAYVGLGGRYVGRAYLEVTYTPPNSLPIQIANEDTKDHEIVCIAGEGYLNTIASYVFTIWLIISYVTMGCKMNLPIIRKKLWPPAGIIIGMLCQFIIMPGLAYGLARMFELPFFLSVGLILIGTCPGGWISNVLTVLFDCDFVLSLTMTAFSTVIALPMMPLNLFIYVDVIQAAEGDIQLPYVNLITQLLLLIIPLGVGILLTWKWPVLENRAEKFMKPFATILVIIAVGLGIPTQIYVFYVSVKGWVVSLLLPCFGAFFGLGIARIVNQPYKASVTIAFETAVQNALLAKVMANLFFGKPDGDLIGILPLLTAVLTAVEGLFAAIIYTIVKKIRDRRREAHEDAEDRVTMVSLPKQKGDDDVTNTNGDASTNGISKEKEAEAKDGTDNPTYTS